MVSGSEGQIADRARVSHWGRGCHSPVTIVTKKYLLSPFSGPGSALGVEKDSRDVLYHLCCQRAQHLLETLGTGPPEGVTQGPTAPQHSLERQVHGGPSLGGGV